MGMERTLLSPLILLPLLVFSSATWNSWWGFPLYPSDVLPFLPWKVSRSIIGRLRNPLDLVPAFLGHVRASSNSSLEWKGRCFGRNVAWVELHNASASEFGGGKLHIKIRKPCRWACADLYIFATPFHLTWRFFFFSGVHTVDFRRWEGEPEYQYVTTEGVLIFSMESGMMGTLRALREVFSLFTDTGRGEKVNVDFLKQRMGATFERRRGPWESKVNPVDLQTGDLLVLSKLRGRWGGFETLEKWVTGSYAGHSTVCLRDDDGKLWIAESGHEASEGLDVIAIVPWEEWWETEVKREGSDPHIALLPLHPDVRANFNKAAAWEYARSMEGKPYGYHNMLFSWIDTVDANFPEPVDSHLVASFIVLWNRLQPEYAPIFWDEALNKRLGTKGLSFSDIMVESEKRGVSFNELLAMPERDEWVYSEGQSVSCISFVVGIYKAAGLFGPVASNIHVTEFTIKDAYNLKFYEDNASRVPSWCEAGGSNEVGIFCQILGKYQMELPGYNTVLPYPHMNENCPTLPPDYSRPLNC